jgi:hypothetical protein
MKLLVTELMVLCRAHILPPNPSTAAVPDATLIRYSATPSRPGHSRADPRRRRQ